MKRQFNFWASALASVLFPAPFIPQTKITLPILFSPVYSKKFLFIALFDPKSRLCSTALQAMRAPDKTYYPIQLCIIHHKAIVWDFHKYIASAPRNPDGCGLYDHWSDIAKYSFHILCCKIF